MGSDCEKGMMSWQPVEASLSPVQILYHNSSSNELATDQIDAVQSPKYHPHIKPAMLRTPRDNNAFGWD